MPACQTCGQSLSQSGSTYYCPACNGVSDFPVVDPEPPPVSSPSIHMRPATRSTIRQSNQSAFLIFGAVAGIALVAIVGIGVCAGGAYLFLDSETIGLSAEQRVVCDRFLAGANDPDSVEFVEWWPVRYRDDRALVRVNIRGRNGFGALILNRYAFVVQDGEVIQQFDGDFADAVMRQYPEP